MITDPTQLDDPNWEEARYGVHDWRNHVGEETRAIWNTFNRAQRLAIATDADWQASNEEWE